MQPHTLQKVSALILLVLNTCYLHAQLDTQSVINQAILALQIQDEHPDSAYAIAQDIERISMQYDYSMGISYAHKRMGELENIWGQNDLAKQHMLSVISIRKELLDWEGAAYGCITLSYIYDELGIPDSAFFVLYEALTYQEKTDDISLLAAIHIQLGNLGATYKHSSEEVIGHFEKAQELANSLQDTASLMTLYQQWGNYLFNLDQYDKALKLFLQIKAYQY